MNSLLHFFDSAFGVVIMLAIVAFGIWKLTRSKAGNTSQRLMRWRVGLQFAAICLIMVILLFRH